MALLELLAALLLGLLLDVEACSRPVAAGAADASVPGATASHFPAMPPSKSSSSMIACEHSSISGRRRQRGGRDSLFFVRTGRARCWYTEVRLGLNLAWGIWVVPLYDLSSVFLFHSKRPHILAEFQLIALPPCI